MNQHISAIKQREYEDLMKFYIGEMATQTQSEETERRISEVCQELDMLMGVGNTDTNRYVNSLHVEEVARHAMAFSVFIEGTVARAIDLIDQVETGKDIDEQAFAEMKDLLKEDIELQWERGFLKPYGED